MSETSRPAPLRVGVLGVGNISQQYFATLRGIRDEVLLVAVADLDRDRAEAVGAEQGVRAASPDELLADADVDLVINLTIPAAHADVARRAIAAGKAVYGEKPLAMTLDDARDMVEAASASGLWLGCAPDTVLGTGIQTARRAIDDGLIGTPTAATASFTAAGHEAWHPSPEFYYQPGGGPLLDMGPYYVTALVTLLGPVVSVTGASRRSRDTRVIASGPRAGAEFPVGIDTHVTGVLEHASGALSTIVMSFDAPASRAARIEVHGSEGSLVVPDPNRFDGSPELFTTVSQEWITLPDSGGYISGGRGIGILDFARGSDGGTPRTDATLALHVLDVMESLLRSAEAGRRLRVETSGARPTAVPLTRVLL